MKNGTANNQMPSSIDSIFDELFKEVCIVHEMWFTFAELFQDTSQRVKAFGEAGRGFFHLIKTVLRDNILLALARLSDPPRTMGKENVSLKRLQEAVRQDNPQLADVLNPKLNRLDALCEEIHKQRNRLIAHSDLLTKQDLHPDPLKGVSRADIDEALSLVREIMNAVDVHYRGSGVDYQAPIFEVDVRRFIHFLEEAVECIEKKKRQQRETT